MFGKVLSIQSRVQECTFSVFFCFPSSFIHITPLSSSFPYRESASEEIQTLTEQVGDLQMQKILLRTQRDAFHEKLREAEIEKSSLAGELQVILESQAKSREELQKIQNMSESAREREEYLQRRLLETIRQVEVERAHRSRVETSLGAEKMLR